MSDIKSDLKRVENSLSNLSSHLNYIIHDGADAKPKLIGLDENVNKLQRDVREIRRKVESRQL